MEINDHIKHVHSFNDSLILGTSKGFIMEVDAITF